jgi:hypothetical protein
MDLGHLRTNSVPKGMALILDSLYNASVQLQVDGSKPTVKATLRRASEGETPKPPILDSLYSASAASSGDETTPTRVPPFAITSDVRQQKSGNQLFIPLKVLVFC